MNKDTDRWIKKNGQELLREIGIQKGQKILDCCCGVGNYALPAAKIVGKNGLVHALDRNSGKLVGLKDKCHKLNITNIDIIEKEFESKIPIPDRSIDVVILYDIFWYFSLGDKKLPRLLSETYRVLKDGAILSVYPEHTDAEKLKKKIIEAKFIFNKEFHRMVIHENNIKKGCILNFRKKRQTLESRKKGINKTENS